MRYGGKGNGIDLRRDHEGAEVDWPFGRNGRHLADLKQKKKKPREKIDPLCNISTEIRDQETAERERIRFACGIVPYATKFEAASIKLSDKIRNAGKMIIVGSELVESSEKINGL